MNTRCLHAANCLNGTGNFAFKCANVGDFLHEWRQAERTHIVEQLVTGIVRGRQTFFSQVHACLLGLADRDQDRRAIGFNVESNTSFAKRQPHSIYVIAWKADIERFIGGAAQINACVKDRAHQCCSNKSERYKFSRAKLAERCLKLFE